MIRRCFYAVLIAALFFSGGPALSQNNKQNLPRTNTNNNGGLQINMNGIIGALVTEAAKQAAQEAAKKAAEDAAKKATTPKKTAPTVTQPEPVPTKKVVEYRTIVMPVARPYLYGGRPVILDEPFDLEGVIVEWKGDPYQGMTLIPDYSREDAEKEFGLTVLKERYFFDGSSRVLYRIPKGTTVEQIMDELRKLGILVSIQPQYIYRGSQSAAPVVDLKALQYAPKKLNALIAREAGDGAGVTIGLIDTGLDLSQPEFADADIETFDAMENRPLVSREHGTALAGLMLAHQGLDGIAPGAKLISVRAFDIDDDGNVVSGSFEIAAAIDTAVAQGARVLNLSFAGPRDPLVMSLLDAASEQGVIFVAAAGNGGPDAAPAYPGAHRDAIAVTATDSQDNVFTGANRGYYIAVSAPGVDVLSPMPDGKFELLSGTSIATAHVTAIVALMLEHDPGLTRDRILEILESSAHDLGEPGHDAAYGAGLADAEAAIMAASAE